MLDSEKENIIENTKNFIPYGTEPEKDKMVKSDDWEDRLEMAEEGYGLNVLINDEDWGVRRAVAYRGYGLSILINDEYYYVRRAVLYYLKDNNLTLAEWCERNNKEIDLRKLAFSPYPEARAAAIKSGYVYKESEMYIAPDCKFTPYGTNIEKDKMVKSDDWEDRLEMAKGSYGLDILINDEDCDVRIAVVNRGYGLDVLINDENCDVRIAVVNQGYGLDVLINDEDWSVRKAVLNYLKDNNLTLAEWCERNNKEIDLRKLAFSPYLEVRFEAVRSGYIYKKDEIYIDSNCKFIPYGTDPEKDKMVKSDDWEDRLEMAEQGYGLDVLINDEDWVAREAVANQGYGLDILINDKAWSVRKAVANQGYGLDILINDKAWSVRKAVADQGYGLDILINDEDWEVRAAVAKQGYGLDVLINDEDWKVQEAVADQGYGLDVLINDEDWLVRRAVLDYLKDNNLTLAEWCDQNNKEIDLRKLAFSPYPDVRIAAIESGYVYKESEMYIAPDCKFIPYGTDPEKDKMVKSDDWEDRLEMAEEGYGLDILINDEDRRIREAVANQGYGLDVLINDENCDVRIAVVNQGYGLDVLINDEDWSVRKAVAYQGYGLAILINDENWIIRRAVANQGYGLDVLINDEDYDVRKAVKNYLTSHNLTIEQWKSNQEHSETDIINQAKNAINDGKIDVKNVANNIRSTDNILNTNINKIDEINEISESNNINK